MLLLRPLFWLAALFAVGSVKADDPHHVQFSFHNTGNYNRVVRILWSPSVSHPASSISDTGQIDVPVPHGATVPYDLTVNGTVHDNDLFAHIEIQELGEPHDEVGYSYISTDSTITGTVIPGHSGADYQISPDFFGPSGPTITTEWSATFAPEVTPGDQRTLWRIPDDTLTADLFREGVDKVVYAVNNTAASSDGGTGTGGTGGRNMTGDDVQDFAHAQFQIKTDTEAAQADFVSTAPDSAAVANFQALMPSGLPTSLPHAVEASGSDDFLKITLPDRFGGSLPGVVPVDFNPFREDRLAGVATWFRNATAWLALMLLAYLIFQETKTFFIAASAARQAQGNPVAGGTGAQATALTAAGIISGLFVALVTGLMSWAFGDITIPALVSNMSSDPLSGAPAHMVWFLDQFLPLATLISCFIARVSFPMYGQTLYGVFITFVRWVVP